GLREGRAVSAERDGERRSDLHPPARLAVLAGEEIAELVVLDRVVGRLDLLLGHRLGGRLPGLERGLLGGVLLVGRDLRAREVRLVRDVLLPRRVGALAGRDSVLSGAAGGRRGALEALVRLAE